MSVQMATMAYTVKTLKIRIPEKFAVIALKFGQGGKCVE